MSSRPAELAEPERSPQAPNKEAIAIKAAMRTVLVIVQPGNDIVTFNFSCILSDALK